MLSTVKKSKSSAMKAVLGQSMLRLKMRKLKNNKKASFALKKSAVNTKLVYYKRISFQHNNTGRNLARLNERYIVKNYAAMHAKQAQLPLYNSPATPRTFRLTKLRLESRGYIKHLVRLRYRWHFRHELGQFKLFRRFFKRSLKRYRKIQKNRLFVTKFRNNFSKLTGFNEKFIYLKWLKFRRNFNQYWSTTNAVSRFSQVLALAPRGFLVILNVTPSLAAGKYIINSGAVTINGNTATSFSKFIPGDIMQLNSTAFKTTRALFNYQKWSKGLQALNLPRYIHADWSSMLFSLLRWPQSFELLAPSFLSERWVRYYIRNFPTKVSRFRTARYNTKVYKEITVKK